MKNNLPVVGVVLLLILPSMSVHADPSIDAIYNADVLLVVGCALMFGFGVLVGK